MSELEPTRTYSNRTGLDPATLARSLRCTAGDGSIEWVHEPMQTRVLLDMADMLDENASLRDRITTQAQTIQVYRDESREWREVAERAQAENAELKSQVAEYATDSVVNKEMVDDLRVALSGRNKSVYVVMESDELMTEGTPTLAFWDAEAAMKCSHERQREDEDGVTHYAWVQEVRVVAE